MATFDVTIATKLTSWSTFFLRCTNILKKLLSMYDTMVRESVYCQSPSHFSGNPNNVAAICTFDSLVIALRFFHDVKFREVEHHEKDYFH